MSLGKKKQQINNDFKYETLQSAKKVSLTCSHAHRGSGLCDAAAW